MNNRLQRTALSALLSLSFTVNADLNDNITYCANKPNETEKLSCYDNIAQKMTKTSDSKSRKKSTSHWKVSKSASDNSKRQNVVLKLAAETTTRKGNQQSTPYLIIRCTNNKTTVHVEWNAYISDRNIKVSTRFDGGYLDTQSWLISSDFTATFPKYYNYIQFIKTLMKQNTMTNYVLPYGRGAISAVFDLTGLKNAVQPLRNACEW